MAYYGGKAKTARYIVPIINAIKQHNNIRWTVEPFCGGCNITAGLTGCVIASDNNPYIIAMWQALQRGWEPPDVVPEVLYKHIKANMDGHPQELVGFVGHGCSFGGKWFSGYWRSKGRYGVKEHKKQIITYNRNMSNVIFICCDYAAVPLPETPCLIYCDPVYYRTNGAYFAKQWDHRRFYAWCDAKVEEGHIVLISDSTPPRDFIPIWSKTFTRDLKGGINNVADKLTTEVLCAHVSQLDKVPREILTGEFIQKFTPEKRRGRR